MSKIAQEIIIKTKKRLFSPNLGNNQSTFIGNGMDFSELREYHYGDDVRKINHKATAKEQKPYINLFSEERELNIVLVFLLSSTVYFGTKRFKQETMAEVMALLAYSALKNRDRVSTIFFSNKEEYFRGPTKNLHLIDDIVPKAVEIDPLKKEIDFKELSDYLLGRIKQKSIIFLIGDFYKECDLSLLASKHELYSIIIRDHFEENPSFKQEIDLIDLNNAEEVSVKMDSRLQKRFSKIIQANDKRLYEHFEKNRIFYTKIYTDEDPFFKLSNLVR